MKSTSLAIFIAACRLTYAQTYSLGPDSQRQDNVPKGKVTQHTWNNSSLYPGTTRDYWVYVPAQYDGSKPACLMIFQDGGGFVTETGAWRAPIVLDNLIHQGAMPVTIAIFINPGVAPGTSADKAPRYNRSYEYDALGDHYARFLLEEILPAVDKQYRLSSNPDDRAVGGSSSGGIAAFTAAWERPDAFHRVLSFIGSYTNLRGGDIYTSLIRKLEPKPLRVYVQDGSNDQDIYSGSWYLANQNVVKSLEWAGYDVKFEVGTEGHNSRHGAAILPDALRWLWRDYPKPIVKSKSSKGDQRTITAFLDPDHDWEIAGEGYQQTEGPAVDKDGNVYFCDAAGSKIHKIGADKKITLFQSNTGGATGLMFGPDGRLYAAEHARKRVVAYSPDGKLSVLATGVTPNDLAVTSKGDIYFTDTPAQKLWRIDAKGAKSVVAAGNGKAVRLIPDESLLVVADPLSRTPLSFRVQPDGGLTDMQAFYHLESAGAHGMTFDDQGHLYVATKLGIQICDQAGRVVGIIRNPSADDPTSVVFGGPDLKTLYVTAGGKVFRRQLRRKGVFPWQPVKLPRPQL